MLRIMGVAMRIIWTRENWLDLTLGSLESGAVEAGRLGYVVERTYPGSG